jgi:uncharacterized repeat protein (TIGR03803 family)
MRKMVQHLARISRIRTCAMTTTLLSALVLAPAILMAQAAQANHFKVLHTFSGGTDGGYPTANLLLDPAGNLYGTTFYGGDLSCSLGADGCGTAFVLNKAGEEQEKVLHAFTGGADGAFPDFAGLIRDTAENLYGTAALGGNLSDCGGSGCGVVFKLTKAGKYTMLYAFTGGTDGANPEAPLVMDAVGNLYGTTALGGNLSDCSGFGCGVVFKMTKTGKYTVLYTFTDGTDGAIPSGPGGLALDAAGNLYGTTNYGGDLSCNAPYGCGVVFKLNKYGNEKALYAFKGGNDGGLPVAGVTWDRTTGNLYGMTYGNGTYNYGVVFKLNKAGHETVLHTFTGGADGGRAYGNLLMDAKGNLYGTTADGGSNRSGCYGFGCGVVFELNKTGKETVLYDFTGEADGGVPATGLIQDAAGNLYGTDQYGGNPSGCGGSGCGVVFKLTP